MPTLTTDEKTQKFHLCRVYGFSASIEHVKRLCPYYEKTKCQVYNHVCSVWETDNQAKTLSSPSCTEVEVPKEKNHSPYDPEIFEALARLPEPTPLELLTISPAALRENPFEK